MSAVEKPLVAPGVSLSTIVGLAVMDMIDAGQHVTLFVHDMPDEDRETLLGKLVELGLVRKDNPSNRDGRSVEHPAGPTYLTVHLWGT